MPSFLAGPFFPIDVVFAHSSSPEYPLPYVVLTRGEGGGGGGGGACRQNR